jgi:hypothetical protein
MCNFGEFKAKNTETESVVKITIHASAQDEFTRQSKENGSRPSFRINIIGYG